ncbi:MAG: hypothetical protein ACREJ3_03695 [Polyangiaceae bacterium]
MRMRSKRATWFPSAATVGLIVLSSAMARAGGAEDQAAAESLFDQGKALMAQHKYADACPKFAESLRLDSGVGTMLYLADCYERTGQTASAWGQFSEAAAEARKEGDSREKIARARAARLLPLLSSLVVQVSAADAPGLEVKRDGSALDRALWGTAIPVDPGKHTVEAVASGKKAWKGEVDVAAGGAHASLVVPALEDAPAVASTPAVLPAAPATATTTTTTQPASPVEGDVEARSHTRRTLGLIAGGLGVVGVGLGAYFGLKASSTYSASNAGGHCGPDNHCDPTGLSDRSDASSQATISTVAFIVGGAALAGGALLYFTAPKAAVRVGVAPGSVMLDGTF